MKRNPFVRKAMSAFLALAMLLSMIPTMAFATGDGAAAESASGGTAESVAYIGTTGYESLDTALANAKEAGETEVEITVTGDIKLTDAIKDFTKVTFNGNNREQTVDMNLGSSIDVNTELVFNNLTVSRLDGGTNGWLYHYTYIRGGLTYNNCKMVGVFNVTVQDTDFIGCDFYNDDTFGDGNYSLWLYNCAEGVEVNITNCTFDVYERAIKMYGDGYNGAMTLDISGTEFKSRTADKTVVEMAYDNATGTGAMNLNIDSTSTATGFGAPEHIEGEANAWFNVECTTGDAGTYTDSTVTIDNQVVYESKTPVVSGTITGCLVDVSDSAETFIASEINDLNATESVVIKLYSGETQIATTTLQKSEYYVMDTLGVKIIITGESSSWKTEWAEGMPRADYVPDKVVLFVDGQEMNSANVPMTSTNGELAVDWAKVPGVNPAPITPAGELQVAYTDANYNNSGVSAISGEAINVVATESFVVKLYSGETLVGTASLVDEDKVFLDGTSRTVTWHAALANDGDSWWNTEWSNGALNVNALPDTAELWVDGVEVDTCAVQLNIQDLKNPVMAAVTDADGDVQSFVAGTGHLNSTLEYDTALQTALNAGGNIVMLRDAKVTEPLTVPEGITVTLDLNGNEISAGADPENSAKTIYALKNYGTLTIKDSGENGEIVSHGLYNYGDMTLESGIISADGVGGGGHALRVYGDFTMNGGTIRTIYDDDPQGTSGTKEEYTYIGADPACVKVYKDATVTLNGGTITNICNASNAISTVGTVIVPKDSTIVVNSCNSAFGSAADDAVPTVTIAGGTFNTSGGFNMNGSGVVVASAGTWNISGGTFTAKHKEGDTSDGINCPIYALHVGEAGAANVTVTGGTFTGEDHAVFVYDGYSPALSISGGTFDGKFTVSGNKASVAVSGGTFNEDPSDYRADGYVALKNLDGYYVVGKKPTATVNNMGAMTIPAGEWSDLSFKPGTVDMPLNFVMQFLADQTEADMATSPYADWYGDFVLTFTGIENGSFTADDCYLAGYYGSFGWVKVPVDGMVIEEGARYPVMLGYGAGQKYDYICTGVKDFRCAMFLTEEILEANPNLEVNLELSIVDNSKGQDAAKAALAGNDATAYNRINDIAYDAEDFKAPITVTSADNSTANYATLAAAFAAAKRGDTIKLLDNITVTETITVIDNNVLSDITLDGNGYTITGDRIINFGDDTKSAWATGVKIKNVTVKQIEGGSNTTAIKLTGGTLSELTDVKVEGNYAYGINFYGTHGATLTGCDIVSAFVNGQDDYPLKLVNSKIGSLTANSSEAEDGAKVFVDKDSSIETVVCGGDNSGMIDPDSVARIGTVLLATGETWADTVAPVAEVDGVYYATLEAAIVAATKGETVILLADVEVTESIKVTGTVTVDLNGKTLTGPDDGKANWYTFIVDGGNLTLKDSVGGGELWAKCYGVETKSGTFTMESGTITATKNGTVGTAIVNYGGNVIVNGGTLSGNLASVYTGGYFSDATTTIKGGTLNGTVAVENWADKDFNETVSSALNTYPVDESQEWVLDAESNLYVLTEKTVDPFNVAGANIKMGSDLTMFFYVNKADLVGTDYYAVVTKKYADGRADVVKTIQYADWEDYDDTRMRFGFEGIAAKEMADSIHVTVYNADGTEASAEWVDSIRAYAMRGVNSENTEIRTMMVDILNYGAEAQTYFEYNTNDLANNLLTEEQKAFATGEIELVNNQVKGKNQIGSTLTFADKVEMTMYFNDLTDGMYAVFTYTDSYGHDYEVKVTDIVTGYGYEGFRLDKLAAADYKALVTCTVYNADGTVYDTAKDSMESYAVRAKDNAVEALSVLAMKYGASAYAYLH